MFQRQGQQEELVYQSVKMEEQVVMLEKMEKVDKLVEVLQEHQ